MQSPNNWQSTNSATDLWEVEWTAFLPSWGKSAVPHYKWDCTPATNWGQSVPNQPKQQWNSWEQNKSKWESKWWPQKNSASDGHVWNKGLYTQDKGVVRGAIGWELHQEKCAQVAPTGGAEVALATRSNIGGALPSVGSAGHEQGLCKRCAFFPKGRCKNGADCTHCHMEHPKQVRHRRRAQNRVNRGARLEAEISDEFFDEDDVAEENGELDLLEKGDATAIAEQPFQFLSYYTTNVLPTCKDMFWNALYQHFNIKEKVVPSVEFDPSNKPHPKNDSLDFECPAEADTTCPSEGELTFVTQSLAYTKFHAASSSDEHFEVSAKMMPKAQPTNNAAGTQKLPWRAPSRSAAQVEVSSITETEALAGELPGKAKRVKGLTMSAGSWAAQQRLRRVEKEGLSEDISADEIGRKARSLLNKLTQEKFETLCQQILALPICTPDHLAAVVAEVFEKATTQRHFLMLYTELCARMDIHLAKEESSGVGGKVFRKALVTECQACFERNLQQPFDPNSAADLTYEERYELEVKHKTRTLGNMRFIGELLVRKLLAAKVFFFIVNEMLDIGNDAALESLAELLSIVAPTFEQKQSIYTAPLREVFAALKKKSKDAKVSTCIRCKLCDLLDARNRGWTQKEITSK